MLAHAAQITSDRRATGVAQGIWEVTLNAKFKLTDYMYIRGEYRHDESNRRLFVHEANGLVRGQDTLARELGHAF